MDVIQSAVFCLVERSRNVDFFENKKVKLKFLLNYCVLCGQTHLFRVVILPVSVSMVSSSVLCLFVRRSF